MDLKVTGVDWVVGGFFAASLLTRHIQLHLLDSCPGKRMALGARQN